MAVVNRCGGRDDGIRTSDEEDTVMRPTMKVPPVVAGVFESNEDAEAAIADLRKIGLLDESIGLVVPDPERHLPVEKRAGEELKGTVAGALIGTPIGGLAGLAATMLFIPGAGAVALAGAVGGALWGAYIGGVAGFTARVRNDPDEDLWYDIPLRSGQILVGAGARSARRDAPAQRAVLRWRNLPGKRALEAGSGGVAGYASEAPAARCIVIERRPRGV
jgi:hypothetical protein